jgi:CRISPR-associated protein Cas2
MRQMYLASYDIEHPRNLHSALQLIRGFATGGQKSIHECFLTATERNSLLHNMNLLIELPVDRFLILRLDPRACMFTFGIAVQPATSNTCYFG